jgi:hypothetical protein
MTASDFGSQLRKLRPDWWNYNLNYDELNKRLLGVKKEFGLRRALSSRSLTGETRTFAEILDQDVEKIVMFYLRAQGDLATRLWEMRQQQIRNLEGYDLSVEQIESMCQKYRDLGQDVMDLLNYLDLNVVGLRKIIKKHDKQFDLQMGNMYFGSRMGQNSQLVQLYHQEGLCAIIGTIRRGFEDLYEAKETLLYGDIPEYTSNNDLSTQRSFYLGGGSAAMRSVSNSLIYYSSLCFFIIYVCNVATKQYPTIILTLCTYISTRTVRIFIFACQLKCIQE